MMLLIGTDEAGYGPNLGPLVVSATAWSVPPEGNPSELGKALQNAGFNIGDSKQLYRSGGSLNVLERECWIARSATKKITVSIEMSRSDPCWQDDTFKKSNTPDSLRSPLGTLVDNFRKVLDQFGVQLIHLRSHIVGTAAFNQRLDASKSKGTLLSEVTLEIVRNLLDTMPESRLKGIILCDKHGGRNRYLDFLTRFFPEESFRVVEESRSLSVYRSDNLEFRFQSKGESELPIALASMLSKYQREVSMHKFNEFWRSHLPGLEPTAGYPEDAKRFKAEIAAVQAELGLADDLIWRKK